MKSPAEYAALKGIVPKGRVDVVEWFDTHPETLQQVAECRAAGWSWTQVHSYLCDEWGFPLKDYKAIQRALNAR